MSDQSDVLSDQSNRTTSPDALDHDFLITSTTMTPTMESDRDFRLHGRPLTINIQCVCVGECTCERTESDSSSPRSTTPLLLSSPSQLDSGEVTPVRYGSITSDDDDDEPLVLTGERHIEASVRCGCHVKIKDSTSKKARMKLIIACIVALLFMCGEVVGNFYWHM